MLTFKTQFPVDPSKTIEDLIEVGRIWLAGSPHSKLAETMASARAIGDEWQASSGTETVVFLKPEGPEALCGISFENTDENSVRWSTEIVGSKRGGEFWVSIQLGVDSELPTERIEYGRRPHILKTIMREIGGGPDGKMSVSDHPLYLREDQLDLATDLICGTAGCVMPVVYVSADNNDNPHIDAVQLAHWLSGMAHVIVEPTRRFSYELMHMVDGENAYGGAVAIYWPDGIGKWLFLPTGENSDPKQMQIGVSRKVRMSLLSQRTRRDCTLSYLQEIKTRRRIQELRDSGSSEVDEWSEMFDREMESKNEEIQRLENEINRLKYAARYEGEARAEDRRGLVLQGRERDLFQGERLAVVIDALKKEIAASEPYSRRRAVVEDLIVSNEQEGQRESMLDELKETLRQYSSMSSAARTTLERLGFEITEEGKHYKLIFRGDNRFPFTLPKTGSDYRGGLNAFSDMKKKLF